jgi:histidine triad (HIT) family protein
VSSDCIFCKIVEGEAPARKIYDGRTVMAILDIGGYYFLGTEQAVPGRTLVIPKRHVERFYELEDEVVAEAFIVAKNISAVLKKVFNPEVVDLVVRGQRVPHTHIILIPEFKENDPLCMMFQLLEVAFKPKFPDDVLDDMYHRIKDAWADATSAQIPSPTAKLRAES